MQANVTEGSNRSNGSSDSLDSTLVTCTETVTFTEAEEEELESFYYSFKVCSAFLRPLAFLIMMIQRLGRQAELASGALNAFALSWQLIPAPQFVSMRTSRSKRSVCFFPAGDQWEEISVFSEEQESDLCVTKGWYIDIELLS